MSDQGPPSWNGLTGRGKPREESVEQELSFHVEGRIDELVEQGWDPGEARREIERRFGNSTRIAAECRAIDTRHSRAKRAEDFIVRSWLNVRLAFRSLGRNPAFAATAILTLALGIGTNTAVFSAVNGVLIRPLPYRDAGSLVVVWPEMVTNVRGMEWIAQNTRSFDLVAGSSPASFALTGDGPAEQVKASWVTPAYFDVLGVEPVLGRTFSADEDEPGRSRLAVLSNGLWRERYAADPAVIGRTILISQVPYTVIGVLPADFRSLEPESRIWVPQQVEPGTTAGTDGTWWINRRIARLADGVTVAEALLDLRAAAGKLAEEYPRDFNRAEAPLATVAPLREAVVGDFSRALKILFGAAVLVLAIACANVTNLLLSRSGAREREVAVRTAIGAGRGQIVAQLVTEGLVLGVIGGAAGLAMAWATLAAFQAAPAIDIPRLDEVRIDTPVLVFTLAVSLATPLLVGLLPAWRATRHQVNDVLRPGSRGAVGSGSSGRLMGRVIAAEVALSLMLAIASGLLVNSLRRQAGVDPGFRPENVLTLHVTVPLSADTVQGGPDLDVYGALWTSLAALPGVRAVGGIQALPLTEVNNRYPYWADDNLPAAGTRAPATNIRSATPGYLSAMGVPLLEGRWFEEADRDGVPLAMAMNETLAKRLWPNQSPLGKRVRLLSETSPEWTVVGVVGDVRQTDLTRAPSGEIYLPHAQWAFQSMFVSVATTQAPETLAPSVRQAITAVDADITIARVETMESVVARSISFDRFVTGLVGVFGLLALVLGAVGVYGVGAHATLNRTQEFGVRMALGSGRRGIVYRAMKEGLVPVAWGVLVGLVGALAASRLLRSLLFELTPTDPLTWTVAVSALVVVAAVACYLPARRIARLDPTEALRSD
jgi:putative ABC transport system permease protein